MRMFFSSFLVHSSLAIDDLNVFLAPMFLLLFWLIENTCVIISFCLVEKQKNSFDSADNGAHSPRNHVHNAHFFAVSPSSTVIGPEHVCVSDSRFVCFFYFVLCLQVICESA